jgi:hypothetical protein
MRKNIKLIPKKSGMFLIIAIKGKEILHMESINQSAFYLIFYSFVYLLVDIFETKIIAKQGIIDVKIKNKF